MTITCRGPNESVKNATIPAEWKESKSELPDSDRQVHVIAAGDFDTETDILAIGTFNPQRGWDVDHQDTYNIVYYWKELSQVTKELIKIKRSKE